MRADVAQAVNADAKPDTRVTLTLYRHEPAGKMPKAWLLSPTGNRYHTRIIPRSLCEEPRAETKEKPHGEAVHKGVWRIEKWKLDEIGWMPGADERQGSMF